MTYFETLLQPFLNNVGVNDASQCNLDSCNEHIGQGGGRECVGNNVNNVSQVINMYESCNYPYPAFSYFCSFSIVSHPTLLCCYVEPHLHGDPFDATDSGRCLYGPKNYTSTSSHPPQVGQRTERVWFRVQNQGLH